MARIRQLVRIRAERGVLQLGISHLRRICQRVDETCPVEDGKDSALNTLCALLGELHSKDIELHNHAWPIERAIERFEMMEGGSLQIGTVIDMPEQRS